MVHHGLRALKFVKPGPNERKTARFALTGRVYNLKLEFYSLHGWFIDETWVCVGFLGHKQDQKMNPYVRKVHHDVAGTSGLKRDFWLTSGL